jgi:hypothetical protein
MRRALIVIAALLAAAGLGALAASGLAGGEPGPPAGITFDPDRELGPLAVERVRDPGPSTRSAAGARGTGNGQLVFFQTPEPFEIAPQTEEGATLQCPKGYKAIGGYYLTGREGTFLDLNAPEIADPPSDPQTEKPSLRNWVIAVFNSQGEADQVRFGVVCLRKGG